MQSASSSSTSSPSAKAALQYFLTTPQPHLHHPHSNPVATAHAALETLRNSGDEQWLFLRTLLELLHERHHDSSRNSSARNANHEDELMFHCVTGCRHVVLHGWRRRHGEALLWGFRDFCLLLGHWLGRQQQQQVMATSTTTSTLRTLQIACYNTSVALWKRGWLEWSASQQQQQQLHSAPMDAQQQSLLHGMQQLVPWLVSSSSHSAPSITPATVPFLQKPPELFHYLEQVMIQPLQATAAHDSNDQQQIVILQQHLFATEYTTSLVQEFAAASKSTVDYQLPLEFHRQTRLAFESSSSSNNADTTTTAGLTTSLKLSMTALSRLLPLLQQQLSAVDNTNTPTSSSSSSSSLQLTIKSALAAILLTTDVLEWEFGLDAIALNDNDTTTFRATFLRPPVAWKEHLIQDPNFSRTLWGVHQQLRRQVVALNSSLSSSQQQPRDQNHMFQLARAVRQLLLVLATLDGPIFSTTATTTTNAKVETLAPVLQGALELLQAQVAEFQTAAATTVQRQSSLPNKNSINIDGWQYKEVSDGLVIVTRLVANLKWNNLLLLPQQWLQSLFQSLTAMGTMLWQLHIHDAQAVHGDLSCMEYGDLREEALGDVLGAVVLLGADPWLWYSAQQEQRQWARHVLAETVGGPLYQVWIHGRAQLAALEEAYLVRHEEELDEDQEYISSVRLQEEMELVASLGRIHLGHSVTALSQLFQQVVPPLQAQWKEPQQEVTPIVAGWLEQARLLTMYIGHLLTDDNTGETPVIPDAIVIACREPPADNSAVATTGGDHNSVIQCIVSSVEALFAFAQTQAVQIAANPEDPRLSPLLATSVLWFLNRWAPAYIYSVDYAGTCPTNGSNPNNIGVVWAQPDKAQQVVDFALTLCLHFHCYWPLERPVQEGAVTLLLSLAKRAAGGSPSVGPQEHHAKQMIRSLMVASPVLTQLVLFHCLTAATRHSMPQTEFEATVRAKIHEHSLPKSLDMNMLMGYQRLPYVIKARILTALLVACSESKDEAMWKNCLNAVQDAFSSLVHALTSKQVSSSDLNAKEMTCLCVEMFRGVTQAGDMNDPIRVPIFVTPHLPHLSGLMNYYADDLTICERLLQFFRDYTEQFVIMLNREQCLALFQASAELLKSYSSQHCDSKTRVIVTRSSAEASSIEEQTYGDILCAIQLLIHLGTKDFIDICSEPSVPGVNSTQVTDIIFFGLQQILPLMTQGLLQLPTLCTQYFSLVGFMMETYPDKIAVLPYELFDALLESLLFGMCHHDAVVAKNSLQGIASITREHLKAQVLTTHLSRNPEMLDKCSSRLLRDVVFRNKVWDRLESAGMALLPLVAVDVNRFATVVHRLLDQVPVDDQRTRLQSSFQSLLQPDILSKVGSGGLDGRKNRIRFKKDFENFVHDVHSFLVLK